jgi:hypothetical protein
MTRSILPETSRNLEELLFHMPTVARLAKTDFVKGFALSVVKQSHRRNWTPSAKQYALIRQMVSDLFTQTHNEADDDIDLIER